MKLSFMDYLVFAVAVVLMLALGILSQYVRGFLVWPFYAAVLILGFAAGRNYVMLEPPGLVWKVKLLLLFFAMLVGFGFQTAALPEDPDRTLWVPVAINLLTAAVLVGVSHCVAGAAMRLVLDEPAEGEKVQQVSLANWLARGLGTDGCLFLTNRRLVFQPREKRKPSAIPLKEIAGAKPALSWYLFPNALLVVTTGGKRYRFRVLDRERWIVRIRKAIAQSDD